MFTDDQTTPLTYSIVGDLSDGPLKDVDGNTLTVDCAGSTTCTISTFISGDVGSSSTYTNAEFTASQLSVTGYVKAADSASQAAYSALTIYLTRKLIFTHLNNIYSLQWRLC